MKRYEKIENSQMLSGRVFLFLDNQLSTRVLRIVDCAVVFVIGMLYSRSNDAGCTSSTLFIRGAENYLVVRITPRRFTPRE